MFSMNHFFFWSTITRIYIDYGKNLNYRKITVFLSFTSWACCWMATWNQYSSSFSECPCISNIFRFPNEKYFTWNTVTWRKEKRAAWVNAKLSQSSQTLWYGFSISFKAFFSNSENRCHFRNVRIYLTYLYRRAMLKLKMKIILHNNEEMKPTIVIEDEVLKKMWKIEDCKPG